MSMAELITNVINFDLIVLILQYFVSFLQTNLNASGKSLQYVQWCMDNSNRAQAAPRKLPPSSVEIAVSKQTRASVTSN